jgi:hypothetical protein
MVLEKDKAHIAAMLNQHLNEEVHSDLSLAQLIRYALLNQAIAESENTYQAICERMKMAFVRRITTLIWDEYASNPEAAYVIYWNARHLFIREENEEPWKKWGKPIDEVPTAEALQILLQQWKNDPLINKIKNNPILYPNFDLNGLFAEWEQNVNRINGPLPKTVKTNAQTYGKTAEIITEKETQTDRHTERETHKETKLWEKDIAPRPYLELGHPFETEGIYKHSIFTEEMLKTNPQFEGLTHIFDPKIVVSLNLAPKFDYKSKSYHLIAHPYRAYDGFQKHCTFIEVRQEPSGNLIVKMIDDHDANIIREYLSQDRANPGNHANKVALMQIQKKHLGFDFAGSKPIDLNHPATRTQFLSLLVQAKFASGILEYTPEEIPALKSWIESIGPQKALRAIDLILNPISRSDTR